MRTLTILPFLIGTALVARPLHAEETGATEESGRNVNNLLANGDFERIGKRDMPDRWITKQHAGKRAYDIRGDRMRPHSGDFSLRIHRFDRQVWGLAEQIVPAFHLAGKSVRLRLWVRTDQVGPEGATVYLGAYNGSLMLQESRSVPITGDNDWTQHELTLAIPPETTQIQAGLSLHDAGTAWIDSAELIEIEVTSDDAAKAD